MPFTTHLSQTLLLCLILAIFGTSSSTSSTKLDLCGSHDDIDLSILNHGVIWNLTHEGSNNVMSKFMFSLCSPLKLDNSEWKECDGKIACQQQINKTNQSIIYKGFTPSLVQDQNSIKSLDFTGSGSCSSWNNISYPEILRIHFKCGPHLGSPEFMFAQKCLTILEWTTSAACKQKPKHDETQCYVYDKNGHKRDLTPLIKPNGGYYKVMSDSQDFYINVCSDASEICLSNSSGACMKETGNGQTMHGPMKQVGSFMWYNLSVTEPSSAIPYDHVVLTYFSNAKECNFNSQESVMKTVIRFRCPTDSQKRNHNMDRNPKLISNFDCIYEIEWLTEYACPIKTIQTEANSCEFTEDVHGFNFNLKSLLKTSNDFYKIQDVQLNNESKTKYEITLNVCGGLGKDFPCSDKSWATRAVCLQSKDNKTDRGKVIGNVNEGTLINANGKMMLKYPTKEETCMYGENKMPETTIIEFVCGTDIGKPQFVSFDDCVYYLIWKTSLVCPAQVDDTCSAFTDGTNTTRIDLSLLTRSFNDDAWKAETHEHLRWSRHAKSKDDIIYMNVCDNLPRTSATKQCDPDSAACMFIAKSNSTINLGKFISPPVYNADTKSVELIYTDGFDSRSRKSISSKISFHCQPGSSQSAPVLIDESDGVYEFEWKTPAACPLNVLHGHDCKVYDPFLDFTFDLNDLKDDKHYLIKHGAYSFLLNVCAPIKDHDCTTSKDSNDGDQISICQIEEDGQKRKWSLGKSNSTLTYYNGFINLTYTGGSTYNNKEKTPRKSHILFICDPSAGKGKPEFIGEGNQSYVFRWYTNYACPHMKKTVHCIFESEDKTRSFDLSPLSLLQGNHLSHGHDFENLMKDDKSIFFINICRPLNEMHFPRAEECGHNSAVCRIPFGETTAKVLNLGEVSGPLIESLNDESVNLIYTNGSPCPHDPNKNISTRIQFICDRNEDLGSPIVIYPGSDEVDNEDCVYLIKWKTILMCGSNSPSPTESCIFNDTRLGLSANLSQLKRPSTSPYEIALQSKAKFTVNICGSANSDSSSHCFNSGVCYKPSPKSTEFTNYGVSSSFSFDGKNLKLIYSNGSQCDDNNGLASTEIIFKCDPNVTPETGKPVLIEMNKCLAVFEFETSLVCGLQLPVCSIVNDLNYFNLRQLSTISHAWNASDDKENIYFINVCTKLPDDIECPGLNSAVCKCHLDSEKKIKCDAGLGVPTGDELTVDSNQNLILHYEYGDKNACESRLPAETKITLKCSNTTGKPRFVKETNNKTHCLFEFEWLTYIACPVNQRNDVILKQNNGYLNDERIGAFIDIHQLMSQTFQVNEISRKENYTYLINLNPSNDASIHKLHPECLNAAVCQTKPDSSFFRNLGSLNKLEFHLKGNELQIETISDSNKRCGKNDKKNVTSILMLQCSSSAGVGQPEFLYESNDCDYIFTWDTSLVCPNMFLASVPQEVIPSSDKQGGNATKHRSHTGIWIGFFIIICIFSTFAGLYFVHQKMRPSLMFRFRRFMGSSQHVDTTFHYHQLLSSSLRAPSGIETDGGGHDDDGVVFANTNMLTNNNPFSSSYSHFSNSPVFASTTVPLSLYDDSDVDLLT